jgi:hypothetical protein
LLESIQNGVAIFKIIHDPNDIATSVKLVGLRNGIDAEKMKVFIESNRFLTAIRDSSLEFSAEGLSLLNGDF